MVAKFANGRFKKFFSPYEGHVAEDTPENMELALSDDLEVSCKWLNNDRAPFTEVNDNDTHPVPKSNVHMALFDRLHEKNTKSDVEALRRIRCVKELAGQMNSQVAEQLPGAYNHNTNFLNEMTPVMHIFMFRSIIDLNNEHHNMEYIGQQQHDSGLFVDFDPSGRAVFRQEPSQHRDGCDEIMPLRGEVCDEITLDPAERLLFGGDRGNDVDSQNRADSVDDVMRDVQAIFRFT